MTQHILKLTDLHFLRPLELAFDESVLKFSAEFGHTKFGRVKRNVRVTLVVPSLNSNLKKEKKNVI
jgi:hypothetical protein